MLKPWNGKTASEEKGVLRQTYMEFHYRVGGLRGQEIGELFRVGYRSVSQERRRLRDRLSDDRNAQDLFKGLLGKCSNWRIDPLIQLSRIRNEDYLFYMESQLEDFIIQNWDKTELGEGYELIEEDGELVSQQHRTSIGEIDILAREKSSGKYVIIELKKNQTIDETVGQLTRYMGWIEEYKSNGQPTKGVIITGKYDERLYYAAKKISDV